MFLKIGSNYINSAQIKQIRPVVKPNDPGHYVECQMVDGLIVEGHCHEDRIAMLTRQYLSAPAGLSVTTWASTDLNPTAELLRETLIGFALDGYDELCPLTVESGVIEHPYNLKFPDGRVRSSWGDEFKSESEMVAAAKLRFTKAA